MATYEPTFLANNHSIAPPPGTIMAYIGKDQPDGWLPCNGQTYTATDNRFQYLYSLLNTLNNTSVNTSNQVTTPNLQNCFMYGASTYTNLTLNTGGNSTVTLTSDNLPPHAHGFQLAGSSNRYIYSDTKGNIPDTGSTDYLRSTTTASPSNQIITSNTGDGNSFSILPPYYTVNYIIKY